MYVEDADLTQKMRTRGKAYLVPQYTAIHAWHRAAHRSLKPFLWQLRSLLRYFAKWGFAWGDKKFLQRLFRKFCRKGRSFLLFM